MAVKLSRKVLSATALILMWTIQMPLMSCRSRMESDSQLSAELYRNARDFERLKTMLREDGHVQSVNSEFTTRAIARAMPFQRRH